MIVSVSKKIRLHFHFRFIWTFVWKERKFENNRFFHLEHSNWSGKMISVMINIAWTCLLSVIRTQRILFYRNRRNTFPNRLLRLQTKHSEHKTFWCAHRETIGAYFLARARDNENPEYRILTQGLLRTHCAFSISPTGQSCTNSLDQAKLGNEKFLSVRCRCCPTCIV